MAESNSWPFGSGAFQVRGNIPDCITFQLGGLLRSPNLEYIMPQLSPILTSNRSRQQL
jgi:hypothetical protein